MRRRIPVFRKNQKLSRLADVAPDGSVLTIEEQLRRWVAGDPRHNSARDECCPDFSCCNRELLAPAAVRRKFAGAAGPERNGMLVGFLAALLASQGHKVTAAAHVVPAKRKGRRS